MAVTFHEFTIEPQKNPKAIILKAILDAQTKKMMKECDIAIGTCGRHLKSLGRLHPNTPVKIIPVGTNIPMQKASEAELKALRQKYGIEKAKVWTIFGRLSGFRNPQMTLKVLEEARRQSMPVFLLLLGCVRSSNHRLFEDFIKEARQRNVDRYLIETGDLDVQQVSHHLQITDLFLFSQMDGISTRNTTIMSAMDHGLPIVAYEPVPGNFDGYRIPYGGLVPRGNEAAFTKKTLELTALGSNSAAALCQRQYFADHFEWEKIAAQYRGFLKNA